MLERERQAILQARHTDPHRFLGLHLHEGRWVLRAFRPDATSLRVIPDVSLVPITEARSLGDGLFEAEFDSATAAFGYRLEWTSQQGRSVSLRDPYAFLPSLGAIDLHLLGEGRHLRLHKVLGAHRHREGELEGVAFAVWAPRAERVSVVGDFNHWDGRYHPMRKLGNHGVWELFIPELPEGAAYLFELVGADGVLRTKLDPFAQRTSLQPRTTGILTLERKYRWGDASWLQAREQARGNALPLSIYEVHLGSWMRDYGHPDAKGRPGWLSWRELATKLGAHVKALGFTHIELLPVAEHPFDGSWGYQVTGYFAPTARHGAPEDFKHFVDHFHQLGIGVFLDWVPAHFPKDAFALSRFDGRCLFEHEDPRRGEHPDWGTLVFDYGRNEVRNFLLSNALFWLEEYHLDGLRVDAVASMLYLDYSRKAGEWLPNRYGGRENLEAIAFLRELNETVAREHPGVRMIAEESTAWPMVSKPTWLGGLGFDHKWNMGWMHDTLAYFQMDPLFRRYHHDKVTFGFMYAWSEEFILALSHDEVVHLKRSLLEKMPGDRWRKFAQLRALYAYMWCHPGKKLLFMGAEFAQLREWNHDEGLDWQLLQQSEHAGVMRLLCDLNALYRQSPALWQLDSDSAGFQWSVVGDSEQSVAVFLRYDQAREAPILCAFNATPVPRHAYRLGVPSPGPWFEVLNTDAKDYGGAGLGNFGQAQAELRESHGLPYSLELTLPALSVVIFRGGAVPKKTAKIPGAPALEPTLPEGNGELSTPESPPGDERP